MMKNMCIHFDADETVEGQGTCMLWNDDPYKCIGWLSDKFCCIDYEAAEYFILEKVKK